MALTITAAYLESLVMREPDFAMLFAAPVIVPLVSEQLTWPLARLAHELAGSDVAHTAAADSHLSEHPGAVRPGPGAFPRDPGRPSQGGDHLVTRLRELIEQHYRDNMTLAQYAATLGVTQTRLREACLMVTGMLPESVDPAAHPAGGAAGAAQFHHDHRPDRLLSGLQRSGLFLALFHQGDGPVAAHVSRKAQKQLACLRSLRSGGCIRELPKRKTHGAASHPWVFV